MFINKLSTDPDLFVYVVVTMVLSIVLHELAHGWAAIWQGDRTPIVRGHMTVDPRVHMGATSMIMLVLLGMCYGAMPVDPTRFRSRYGDALVAFAGPLMNLLLAMLVLTGMSIWLVSVGDPSELSVQVDNLLRFLFIFGYSNILLFLLNMIPLPPLDGATVLANLCKPYARLINRVHDPRVFLIGFVVVLVVLSGSLWTAAQEIARSYLGWVISILT